VNHHVYNYALIVEYNYALIVERRPHEQLVLCTTPAVRGSTIPATDKVLEALHAAGSQQCQKESPSRFVALPPRVLFLVTEQALARCLLPVPVPQPSSNSSTRVSSPV
jgi:hypothetical protein